MLKQLCCALLCMTSFHCLAAASLTETEKKWLNAGLPVLEYAREQGLAIDIVVQPLPKAGDVPFAMGVADGRCKLVLSMRGNPDAEKVLNGVPQERIGAVIEAMTAHEVAHCWRYTHGSWHALPAGFVDAPDTGDRELARLRKEMRDTRREEGFADLVGLAWTAHSHPDQYREVHAWFERIREHQPVPGAHHDTRVWIDLAKHPTAFHGQADDPFKQAQPVWKKGLRHE